MADDLYSALGVSRTADQKEIRRAYREKARKFHPDVNKAPGAEETFKRISEAHDVLSDPETRAQYDRFGENFRQYAAADAAQSAAGPRRGGGGTRYSWGGGAGAQSVNWEDLFGGGFGGFGRGADHAAELELTVDEAYRGGKRTVQVGSPFGPAQEYVIDIPAGALDGQRLRIPGAGGTGADGQDGDLLVTLRVKDTKRYRLDGADIETDLPISPWEAALGADVKVPTPGGSVTVHVPPGSSTGRRLRLRGQGMPRRGQPGDLYARVKVVVPRTLTKKEKELFEKLRDESSFDARRGS